jgi:hypothetical protein
MLSQGVQGLYRVWWVYRLFDLFPICHLQDPVALFISEAKTTEKPDVMVGFTPVNHGAELN